MSPVAGTTSASPMAKAMSQAQAAVNTKPQPAQAQAAPVRHAAHQGAGHSPVGSQIDMTV